MSNLLITDTKQDILICLEEQDDTLAKVLQVTYTDNSVIHHSRTLDMMQLNDLINDMTRTLKQLKELQTQIIKSSFNKFVATANNSD